MTRKGNNGKKGDFPNNTFAKVSSKQASEWGRKGAIKSAEVRRRNKKMKDVMKVLLDVPIKHGKISTAEEIQSLADVYNLNLDTRTALLLAQVQKALKGDTKAFTAIRDTVGEKPVERRENQGQINVGMLGDILTQIEVEVEEDIDEIPGEDKGYLPLNDKQEE